MKLLIKLNLAFLCAFAVAMALTVLLNQAKFGDILRGLDDSRVSVVTLDTSRRLRQAVDLGLPLKDIAESQAIVDSLVEEYPELQSVSIFDADGRLLVHGGQALEGDPTDAPGVWTAGNREAGGEVWRLETPESFIVGAAVVNNFGKLEGGVAVRYGRSRYSRIVGGLTDELLETAVVLFVAAGLLTVLGTAAALRRLIVTARRLGTAVAGLLDTAPAATPAEPDMAEFTAYRAKVRETAAALASAEKEGR